MDALFRNGFVEEELRWWNIPGVELGVVRSDEEGHAETLFAGGFGLRDIENGLPMTADTIGGIASCSKAFTSAVVASLVDEGVLDFDTPIREYLPDFALADAFASKECCLRDMLYHRTGIAGHDAMWPCPGLSREEYIRRMRHLQPNRPFRSVAQYSNTVYDLIGFIAEQVSGRSWGQLVRERILEPLGMSRTVLSLAEQQADPDQAIGYFAEDVGIPQPLRRMSGWEMAPIGNPAAGVCSCVTDMLKWLTLHMTNGIYEGKRLYSEQIMGELHAPAIAMSAFPWRFDEVPGYGLYGMGWKTAIYRGMTMVYHCGEIEGYCSITTFLPQRRVGIFLLCNRHTMVTPFMLELVYTAFDRVLGYPEVDWAERLHPYAHDFTGSCYAWGMDLMPPAGAAPDTVIVDRADHAGVYESTAYGQLRIGHGRPEAPLGVGYMADGHEPSEVELYLYYRDWILPLEATRGLGEDTFRVRNLKEDTLFYTVPLCFTRDAHTGVVNGFTLRLEKEVPPIRFDRIAE